MLSKDHRIELSKQIAHYYTNNKSDYPFPLYRCASKEPEGTFNVLKYPKVFNKKMDSMIKDFYEANKILPLTPTNTPKQTISVPRKRKVLQPTPAFSTKLVKQTKPPVDPTIYITEHAFDMGRERLSFDKDAFRKIATKAFAKGLKSSDTKGALKKYMDNLFERYGTADNIRIYGENIFFFKQHNLLTVYQVPQELKKNAQFFNKSKSL